MLINQPTINTNGEVRPTYAEVNFKMVRPGHSVRYSSIWQSDHMVRVVAVPWKI
jgi:hypothetical protein